MKRRYEILIDPEKQEIAVKVISFWAGEKTLGQYRLMVDAYTAITKHEQEEQSDGVTKTRLARGQHLP